MNDFLEQLAAEPLEPSEVRLILERLAVEEFGGPDRPTIGEVAEVGNTSPEAVGRILAQIRGTTLESWKRSFEGRLDGHDERLRRLESAKQTVTPSFAGLKPTYRQPKIELSTDRLIISSVAGIIVVIALVVWIRGVSGSPGSERWRDGVARIGSGGHMFGYDEGCNWSEETSQGLPGPIIHEADARDAENMAAAMKLGCR